jgi:hypothetical protein
MGVFHHPPCWSGRKSGQKRQLGFVVVVVKKARILFDLFLVFVGCVVRREGGSLLLFCFLNND